MLSASWTKFRYHPEQARLWQCKKRFCAVVAGRGSGKTELARRKIVIELAKPKPWSNPMFAYCLPTFRQAKRVAWKPLLSLIPKEWVAKNGVNVTDLTVETKFGSILYVVGMDKPHRIEGSQFDGVVIDESCDQRPGIFDVTILPALTHRQGWCWRIGVPKRTGIGRAEFKDFFERGRRGDPNIESFWWKSSDILSKDELEHFKDILDYQDYMEQFEASWIDLGGTIYYAFSYTENVSEEAYYRADYPIYVGCDFNVDPMCWVLGHYFNNKLYIFDELFIRNTSTEQTVRALAQKYSGHLSGWKIFGDASSRHRKTVTTRTDYIILKNYSGLLNKMVYFPERNPPLKSRFACVNAAFCNSKGERLFIIHTRCKHLINDLTVMAYKKGTMEPEDYSGTDIGHTSDALGYMLMRIMPIRKERDAVAMVVT